jgi:hypothetical protein
LPSDSRESVFNPHTSSHGLSGAELTRLPLNAPTSNQKRNCNARLGFELLSAWITPHDGEPDDQTWIGRVQIGRPHEASEHDRRMIGVAGSVAEHLWRGNVRK